MKKTAIVLAALIALTILSPMVAGGANINANANTDCRYNSPTTVRNVNVGGSVEASGSTETFGTRNVPIPLTWTEEWDIHLQADPTGVSAGMVTVGRNTGLLVAESTTYYNYHSLYWTMSYDQSVDPNFRPQASASAEGSLTGEHILPIVGEDQYAYDRATDYVHC